MKQKLIFAFEIEFLNNTVRYVEHSGFINPTHIVFFDKQYFTHISETYILVKSSNGSSHYIKYSDFVSFFN